MADVRMNTRIFIASIRGVAIVLRLNFCTPLDCDVSPRFSEVPSVYGAVRLLTYEYVLVSTMRQQFQTEIKESAYGVHVEGSSGVGQKGGHYEMARTP